MIRKGIAEFIKGLFPLDQPIIEATIILARIIGDSLGHLVSTFKEILGAK
jgi:hypothetical protein